MVDIQHKQRFKNVCNCIVDVEQKHFIWNFQDVQAFFCVIYFKREKKRLSSERMFIAAVLVGTTLRQACRLLLSYERTRCHVAFFSHSV